MAKEDRIEKPMQLSEEDRQLNALVEKGLMEARAQRVIAARLLTEGVGGAGDGAASGNFNSDNPYNLKPGEQPIYETAIGQQLPNGQPLVKLPGKGTEAGAVGCAADHFHVMASTLGLPVAQAMFPTYGQEAA